MKGFKLYGLVVVTWLIVFSVSQAKAWTYVDDNGIIRGGGMGSCVQCVRGD